LSRQHVRAELIRGNWPRPLQLCTTPDALGGVRSRARPRAHPFASAALTARQVRVGGTSWRPRSADARAARSCRQAGRVSSTWKPGRGSRCCGRTARQPWRRCERQLPPPANWCCRPSAAGGRDGLGVGDAASAVSRGRPSNSRSLLQSSHSGAASWAHPTTALWGTADLPSGRTTCGCPNVCWLTAPTGAHAAKPSRSTTLSQNGTRCRSDAGALLP
jgi:hypothetical protein